MALPELTTPRRANVLGVGIHSLNFQSTIDLMEAAVINKVRGYVCVTGVHGVIEAQDKCAFKRVLNNSFLNVPDGRPTVWVGWAQGCKGMDLVSGPLLILRFCQLASRKGYTQFFYGGAPGVAEQLREVLIQRYPGLKVVGTFTPPFRALDRQEEIAICELFARLKPDVTWIGLSTPKQELFMEQYLDKLDTTLMVGVGAAFDMNVGRSTVPPPWMARAGLAWVHRLIHEPRRLWKRYLKSNPRFIWAITLQLLGLKKYNLEGAE